MISRINSLKANHHPVGDKTHKQCIDYDLKLLLVHVLQHRFKSFFRLSAALH